MPASSASGGGDGDGSISHHDAYVFNIALLGALYVLSISVALLLCASSGKHKDTSNTQNDNNANIGYGDNDNRKNKKKTRPQGIQTSRDVDAAEMNSANGGGGDGSGSSSSSSTRTPPPYSMQPSSPASWPRRSALPSPPPSSSSPLVGNRRANATSSPASRSPVSPNPPASPISRSESHQEFIAQVNQISRVRRSMHPSSSKKNKRGSGGGGGGGSSSGNNSSGGGNNNRSKSISSRLRSLRGGGNRRNSNGDGNTSDLLIVKGNLSLKEKLASGKFGTTFWKAQISTDDGNLVEVEARLMPISQKLLSQAGLEVMMQDRMNGCPNVVAMVGLHVERDNLSVITAHCKGGTLVDYLKETTTWNHASKMDMMIGIANGMEHIASKNVVHRQLRSKNIAVDDFGTCKIANFTSARKLNSDGFLIGKDDGIIQTSTRWCAPEVLLESRFSQSSDVYAFGLVMIEIYQNGEEPFNIVPDEVVREFILKEKQHDRPKNCPEILYSLMTRCWNKVPSDRDTFAELHRRLNLFSSSHILDGQTLGTHRVPLPEPNSSGSGSGLRQTVASSKKRNDRSKAPQQILNKKPFYEYLGTPSEPKKIDARNAQSLPHNLTFQDPQPSKAGEYEWPTKYSMSTPLQRTRKASGSDVSRRERDILIDEADVIPTRSKSERVVQFRDTSTHDSDSSHIGNSGATEVSDDYVTIERDDIDYSSPSTPKRAGKRTVFNDASLQADPSSGKTTEI